MFRCRCRPQQATPPPRHVGARPAKVLISVCPAKGRSAALRAKLQEEVELGPNPPPFAVVRSLLQSHEMRSEPLAVLQQVLSPVLFLQRKRLVALIQVLGSLPRCALHPQQPYRNQKNDSFSALRKIKLLATMKNTRKGSRATGLHRAMCPPTICKPAPWRALGLPST